MINLFRKFIKGLARALLEDSITIVMSIFFIVVVAQFIKPYVPFGFSLGILIISTALALFINDMILMHTKYAKKQYSHLKRKCK